MEAKQPYNISENGFFTNRSLDFYHKFHAAHLGLKITRP